MYCPRCAKEFGAGTAYCRTCGLPLDQVAAVVTGEQDSEPDIKIGPNANLTRYGIGLFILGTVIALGHAMLKDFGLYPEAIGKIVFLFFIMLGMAFIGAGAVFPQKRYLKRHQSGVRDQESGSMALATTDLRTLPPADRSIDDIGSPAIAREQGSVTDHTTRQLI